MLLQLPMVESYYFMDYKILVETCFLSLKKGKYACYV